MPLRYNLFSLIFIVIFSINAFAMPTRQRADSDGTQETLTAQPQPTTSQQVSAAAPININAHGVQINDCLIQKPCLWPILGTGLGASCGALAGAGVVGCASGTPQYVIGVASGCCGCCGCAVGCCAMQIITHAPQPVQNACAVTADYCLGKAYDCVSCKYCCKHSPCHKHQQREEVPLNVIVTQPRRATENEYEVNLMNRSFNRASLQNTKTMLLGATDGTIHSLKQLIFKGHAMCSEEDGHVLNLMPSSRLTRLSRYAVKSTQHPIKNIQYPAKIFGFVDSYEKSLTTKRPLQQNLLGQVQNVRGLRSNISPGRVGIVMFLNSHTSVAFAYNHNTNENRLFTNSSAHTGTKLSQVKITMDGCSLALTINPHKPGFTSSLAACYNFGSAKTSRYYSHGHFYIKAKGSPDVSMHGWIGLLGYNIPVSNTWIITPYLEGVVSMANWGMYKEKALLVPYSISKNKEHIAATNLGIRTSLFATNSSQFQGWVASVSGIKKLSALHSQIHTHHFTPWHNHTLPKQKATYKNIEVGFGYENQLMENMTLGITASLRLKSVNKPEKQNLTTHMNYIF